ncbi:MAG: class I adenylate-forming enzyme family protein, partial [Myxococcota bacterium]|nr:class I adenylate-forming enzyme family protein [Myxococcota bacterium]
RTASWLASAGVGVGDVVALHAPVDLNWWVAFHGIAWLGAVPAPLDPYRTPGAGLARQLDTLRPTLVLSATSIAGPWRCVRMPGSVDAPPCEPASWPLGAPRLVVLTSGTTGEPKVVSLSALQLVLSAFGSASRLGHEPSDRWLCVLPLHHIGGLSIALRAAWLGVTVVLHPRFDAPEVAARLDSGDVTMVSLVPSMLTAILDAREQVPFHPRLRVVLLGGAATTPALLARCQSLSVPVARTWGMTEAASQVATAPPGDWAPGMPQLPFAEVTVLGGVLHVAGPLVGGGVMATGDLGHVDACGRVHVSGRRDAVIITGGEKVPAALIEAALDEHPAVAEACVVGLPDRRWGHRPPRPPGPHQGMHPSKRTRPW